MKIAFSIKGNHFFKRWYKIWNFSNMFESQENTVNIKEVKLDILQMIIDFSYSGEILLTQVIKHCSNYWEFHIINLCFLKPLNLNDFKKIVLHIDFYQYLYKQKYFLLRRTLKMFWGLHHFSKSTHWGMHAANTSHNF